MFRGYTYDGAKAWLDKIYPEQPPEIARKSAAFPNFPKFELVLRQLETNLEEMLRSKSKGKRSVSGVSSKYDDKCGLIVRVSGVDECSHKTWHTTNTLRHKASRHNIEYVIKIPDDGKERNKRG